MPSLSRVIAAPSQATPSSPPPEPQEILDQLIDSIFSSDSQTTLQLLDQVESSYINIRHSTLQLSPLEALFSRYPQLGEADLKIIDSMFEKGAALEMVDEKILKTMMDLESDSPESSEVVREFESRLMKKFAELDEDEDKNEHGQEDGVVDRVQISPLTPISDSPAASHTDLLQRSRCHSIPQLPRETGSLAHSPSHPPSPSDSRDAHRSFPQTQTKLPFYSSRLESVQPQPLPSDRASENTPTELVRLFLALPYEATASSLVFYFQKHLGVALHDIFLYTHYTPSHALIDLDRQLFESGELQRRIERAEHEGRKFKRGPGSWKLRPRLQNWDRKGGRNEESRNNDDQFQAPIQGSEAPHRPQYRPHQFSRSTSTYGRQPRAKDWIELSLSGFPPEIPLSTVETILSQFLQDWKDLLSLQVGDNEMVFKLKVDGEEAARRVETEFGTYAFGGRIIAVTREESNTTRPGSISREEEGVEVPKLKLDESFEEEQAEFASDRKQSKVGGIEWSQALRGTSVPFERREEVMRRFGKEEEIPDIRRRRRRSTSPDRRARYRSYSYSRSPSPVKKRRVREDGRGRRSRDDRSRHYDSDEEEEISSRRRRKKRQDRYRSRSPASSRHSHRYHSPSPSPPRRSRYRCRSPSFDRHRHRSRKNRSPSPVLRHRSPSPSPPRHSSRRIYHHSRNSPASYSCRSSHSSGLLDIREPEKDVPQGQPSISPQPSSYERRTYHSSRSRSPSPPTFSFRLKDLDKLNTSRQLQDADSPIYSAVCADTSDSNALLGCHTIGGRDEGKELVNDESWQEEQSKKPRLCGRRRRRDEQKEDHETLMDYYY